MKLASYEHNGRQSFGVVTDRGIVDAIALLPDGPRSVRELLQAGPDAMAALSQAVNAAATVMPLADVRLLPPVLDPPKLLALAVNYEAHHNELKRPDALPADARHTTTPRPFLMPPTALAGCGDEIAWPIVSEQVDHEVELAVVIGREGRDLSVAEALDVVAGYTIANDLSARSMTHAEGRTERPKDDFFDWLHGKWPDGFLPMGPWLVTADEVGNAGELGIELSVNGDVRQSANTAHMIFSIAETISFISHIVTLQVGDVIATGTPSGVAKATGKWLEPDDVVTCRIDKLGELSNTIGPRPAGFYHPCRKASQPE